jgi:putative transposase
MHAVHDARAQLGCVAACQALGVVRASYYRFEARLCAPTPAPASETRLRKASPRALSTHERESVLALLHSERFADVAVPQVYSQLIDEGQYLCSPRTMYRILDARGEVRERRDQLRRPNYARPELLATAPNQVWSWDITKLRGPTKWSSYSLYVILDIFSRYVVGWMVAPRESATLAQKLIGESVLKHGIARDQLTIHADRGSSMTSKCVALLLSDLGVTKTHSRPHVSNDNPYSEAHFKTLKYRPDFPDRFASIEEARSFCRRFFDWYNRVHRHSALGWIAPADVHHGRAEDVRARRALVLDAAWRRYPERFARQPVPPALPSASWINPPTRATTAVAQ